MEVFRIDVETFAYEGHVVAVALNGVEVDRLTVKSHGIMGDNHANPERTYFPLHGEPYQAWWHTSMKGTSFFNWRSWTAVSSEETDKLAEALGVPEIKPGGLLENFVFSDIPGFSKLPPGAHLVIYGDAGTPVCVLVVHDQNFPCKKTARHLHETHDMKTDLGDLGNAFKEQAEDLRGIMGYVAWPGDNATAAVHPGNVVKVWLPVNAHHQF